MRCESTTDKRKYPTRPCKLIPFRGCSLFRDADRPKRLMTTTRRWFIFCDSKVFDELWDTVSSLVLPWTKYEMFIHVELSVHLKRRHKSAIGRLFLVCQLLSGCDESTTCGRPRLLIVAAVAMIVAGRVTATTAALIRARWGIVWRIYRCIDTSEGALGTGEEGSMRHWRLAGIAWHPFFG